MYYHYGQNQGRVWTPDKGECYGGTLGALPLARSGFCNVRVQAENRGRFGKNLLFGKKFAKKPFTHRQNKVEKMVSSIYTCWQLIQIMTPQINPLLLLQSNQESLLIAEKRSRSDIVVGVPHHAPAGTPQLPCPEHRDADENTGFIGRHLAEKLDCCSVIACNAAVDPNKRLDSDYAKQIVTWTPKILTEIHGHGKVRSKYDVEISCGSEKFTSYAEELAYRINCRLSADERFADVSVCGCFGDIYFRATKTLTITDRRWLAYHIELSSRLRKPIEGRKGRPTEFAYRFCDHLSQALREIHG
jgi:hypothetical protein